jgi:hypothetical protein
MKKNKERDQEPKGKSRRLTLSRETLQPLDDPALLSVAQGGVIRTCNSTTASGGVC